MKHLFAVVLGLLFLAGTGWVRAEDPKPKHPVKHKIKKDIKLADKAIKADQKQINTDKKDIKNEKLQEKVDNAAASQELAGGNDKAAMKYEKKALTAQKEIKADKVNEKKNAELRKGFTEYKKDEEKKLRKVNRKIKEEKSEATVKKDLDLSGTAGKSVPGANLAGSSMGTTTGK